MIPGPLAFKPSELFKVEEEDLQSSIDFPAKEGFGPRAIRVPRVDTASRQDSIDSEEGVTMRASIHRSAMLMSVMLMVLSASPERALSQNIIVAGYNALGPDPRARLNIPVPCAGCPVTIDFSACPDIVIGVPAVQGPGQFVDCIAKTMATFSDAASVATFEIVGAARAGAPLDPGSPEGCAPVVVAGFGVIGFLSVASPDLNGGLGGIFLGVDGTDTLQYLGNRFGGPAAYRPRANYVFAAIPPQAIDGLDTLAFNGFRFGGGSVANGPFCP